MGGLDGRPRITDTSARTATASLVERRGEGVDRRAAHQEPSVGHGTTGRAPPPNRGGGRDGERQTSSRAWRSTADTMCCGSPRRRRRRGGAAALGRDGEAGRARCHRDRHARRDPRRAGVVVGHHHVAGGGFGRPARVDAVESDGYPDAEPLLSLEEETWRQVTLGAGSAAPNTSGEASCTGEREPWRVCGIK